MTVGVIGENRDRKGNVKPFRALFRGLERLGYIVSPMQPRGHWPLWGHNREPDIIFIWNGVHANREEYVQCARGAGIPVLVMERGFFNRFEYTQIDHAGFNHTASWATLPNLKRDIEPEPASPYGQERFEAAWGKPAASFGSREGYALILLQVAGDAQLNESETRHPGPLVQAVEMSAPPELDIRVRSHPLFGWKCGSGRRARMLDGELEDAIAGAKFCITINSNAGNEALAWGCPVLCLGPALYEMAGVAKRCHLCDDGLSGMGRALEEMDLGWRPDERAAHHYLYYLACRQWSRAELADGWPLERLISDARATTNSEA